MAQLRQRGMKLWTDNSSNPKVLVVGLGNVAIGYDLLKTGNRRKTHLFSIKDILELKNLKPDLYGVDVSSNARNVASSHFPSMQCCSSIDELPSIQFDIVIVSVPIPASHEVTLDIIHKLTFRHLLLEKPAASSVAEAIELNQLLSQLSNAYIIYPRRALNSSRWLKSIYSQELSSEYNVEIFYSGEPKNILSHFIDLLEFIFGINEQESFQFQSITTTQTSHKNNDDHSIHISGLIETRYTFGGQYIEVKGIDAPEGIQDFKSEIDSQIWYTAKEYLEFLLGKSNDCFPNQVSSNIITMLKGY